MRELAGILIARGLASAGSAEAVDGAAARAVTPCPSTPSTTLGRPDASQTRSGVTVSLPGGCRYATAVTDLDLSGALAIERPPGLPASTPSAEGPAGMPVRMLAPGQMAFECVSAMGLEIG